MNSVLPAGRPKSSKGAGKKGLAGRIRGRIFPEFYWKWQKRAEENFLKKFLILQ
jgi:hypothetical protein